MEVVASLSQGRTAAAQCGLFTHKSVSVIFEPPCIRTAQILGITATNKLINRKISIKYIARYQKSSRSVSRALEIRTF